MVVPLCLDGTLLHRPCAGADNDTVIPVKIARFDLTDTLIIVTARIWGSPQRQAVLARTRRCCDAEHVVSGRGKDGERAQRARRSAAEALLQGRELVLDLRCLGLSGLPPPLLGELLLSLELGQGLRGRRGFRGRTG